MRSAGMKAATAPPGDPVRAALDDPDVHRELLRQALARLGALLADRPSTVRHDHAAEAIQETGKRAWERRSDFDPSLGKPVAAWLHGILALVLHERCRSLRKQPAQTDAHPEAWDALAARMATSEGTDELHALLGRLGEDQRRVVEMHHLEGLSHDEIAGRLGISSASSRLRLCRAMAALKQLAAKGGDR